MSRSRSATTSSKAASASRRPRSTAASSSTARRAAADSSWARAVAAVQSGKYGKLLVSKGSASKPARALEHRLQARSRRRPATFDFNLWLGPAPEQPFHDNLRPYNWHWFWDFGNGDIGNQGVHEMDIARWAIKDGDAADEGLEPRRPVLPTADQGQTPNMQMA